MTNDNSTPKKPDAEHAPSSSLPPHVRNMLTHGKTLAGLMVGVVALVLLAVGFIGGLYTGVAVGGARHGDLALRQRQLTEDLRKPIGERPLLGPGGSASERLRERGAIGMVIEIDEDYLVIDTPEEVLRIRLTDDTLVRLNKDLATLADLERGQRVIVILEKDSDEPTAKAINIVPEDFDLEKSEGGLRQQRPRG